MALNILFARSFGHVPVLSVSGTSDVANVLQDCTEQIFPKIGLQHVETGNAQVQTGTNRYTKDIVQTDHYTREVNHSYFLYLPGTSDDNTVKALQPELSWNLLGIERPEKVFE